MSALNRKTWRDLIQLRGQVLAICLVMASGIATFVMSLSTLDSLTNTHETYYQKYRFADVFTHLKRAPASLAQRIAEIPGVAQVETRVVEAVTLDMPGLNEPAVGQLISLPQHPGPALNDLYLRSGHFPEPGRAREVLVIEAFAKAHDLHSGDTVRAIINGRFDELRIVGVVLSPEFIYQVRAGELIPDELRFGVFWMDYKELASAFDMDGAFNDVALTLMPGAPEADVIERLDRLTEQYGSLGGYGREDQSSHKYVANEIKEIKGTARVVPVIFLAVAAFLLNVVISRLVKTQREQIAALKALGYGRREIAAHYLKLVMLIAGAAWLLGSAAGAWMGSELTKLYTQFFHFPIFDYHLDGSVLVLAAVASAAAALVGTLGAVLQAMRLPPAEAMRPEAPADFKPTIIERLGVQRLLSPAARMILRQLERRPIKALLSCFGIALGVSVLVVGNFMEDSINYVMEFEFQTVQRYDLMTSFLESTSPGALAEIRHLPGVQQCEPFRAISTRLRAGHRQRRVGVLGLSPESTLFRLVNLDGTLVPIPPDGLILSAKLAELLGVEVGDEVTVEVLQEWRPTRSIPVVGLVADFSGTAAYMSMEAANRLMRQDRGVLNGAFLTADDNKIDELFNTLKETPHVAAVTVKEAALQSFRNTLAENMLLMKTVNVFFAVIIAVGVVYNTARISLSERSRDLATLRVIGFTRAEISLIQLGELAVLTAVAIPVGLILGYGLAALTSANFDTELFRIPLVVSSSTYAFATTVILIATVCSGLIVRRMLDRLDLVSVLKTRE